VFDINIKIMIVFIVCGYFLFATVLLLILSLPGFAIRRSYYASRFSHSFISTNLMNELIWSFIPAIFINGMSIMLIEKCTNHTFKLDYLGYLFWFSGGLLFIKNKRRFRAHNN
jgi:hypothetical protein